VHTKAPQGEYDTASFRETVKLRSEELTKWGPRVLEGVREHQKYVTHRKITHIHNQSSAEIAELEVIGLASRS